MGIDQQKKYEKISHIDGEEFTGCVFQRCDFSSIDLSKIRFEDCLFSSCNFTSTKLENTRMQDVFFYECKFMGINFTQCDNTFLRINFEKCSLRGCNFTELKLKKMKMTDCVVKECHLAQCDLERADFRRSNFEGTVFHHTKLCYANFLEAYHFAIDPLENPLKGAKFSKLEALNLLKGLGILIE